MLEGTDGRKMSTSWGNVININDDPNDMFGKVLAIKDDLIIKYFLLTTDLSVEEISEIQKNLEDGENPKNLKIKLAETLVSMYHGKEEAIKAKDNFSKAFEKGGIPDDLLEVKYNKGTSIVEILLKEGFVESKTEWRRLVKEKAIKILTDESSTQDDKKTGGREDNQKNLQKENIVTDDNVFLENSVVYKIGKRRFLRIISE